MREGFGEVVELPLTALVVGGSPRSAGEDMEHVQRLAESVDDLPPILVHRSTYRVIDGIHRVRAVLQSGGEAVLAQMVECSEQEAFLLAVELNISHGLPLTLADRKIAAGQILLTHAEWSDRAIGKKAGLSHKTVGVLRRTVTGENPHSRRVGLDGRLRALPSPRCGPDATDSVAAVSVGDDGALHGHSARAQRSPTSPGPRCVDAASPGDGDEPARLSARTPISAASSRLSGKESGHRPVLDALMKDPSLRHTETGRSLLRLLTARALTPADWKGLTESVPSHCVHAVSDIAEHYATMWHRFSEELRQVPWASGR